MFPDNDRPGVMSAEAALIYLQAPRLLVGERIVVATNNSGAYAVAAALRDAGARVVVADPRAARRAAQDRRPRGATSTPFMARSSRR